jgi:hypothetical protein
MVKKIYHIGQKWAFIAVGNNLTYDFRFLEYKFAQYYGLSGFNLAERPTIDVKPVLVMHNKG